MRYARLLAILPGLLLTPGAARADDPPPAPTLRDLSPSVLRIVGGRRTTSAEWPWQLLLRIPMRERGTVGYCGASLIAPQWALTAAHCFLGDYDPSQPIEVFEGLTWRDGHGRQAYSKMHLAKAPILEPEFDAKRQQNDIALLRLPEAAVSRPVEPLTRADPKLESPPTVAVATGWGTSKRIEQRHDGTMFDFITKQPIPASSLHLSHTLMAVELPLVDLAECTALNRDVGLVTDHNLCAGAPHGGRDTCKGDSGGPLVTRNTDGRYVQIGVISWGEGCGESNHPGVYTRVSAYGDWLKATMGGERVAAPTEPPKPPATPTKLPPVYDNTAGLDAKLVAIDGGTPVPLDSKALTIGRQIAVSVTTQTPGYIVILDETPDGKLTQIFPNSFSTRSAAGGRERPNLLAAGQERIMPDPRNPYAGFKYVVDRPAGDGIVSVLETDAPLQSVDLGSNGPKTFVSKEERRTYLDRLQRELAARFLPAADAPRYSAVYLPYTIKAETAQTH